MNRKTLINEFKLFSSGNSDGIEDFVNKNSPEELFTKLLVIRQNPLTKVQFNQLLLLSHEKGVSDGFFKYYWQSTPEHPYDVKKLQEYSSTFSDSNYKINSLDHLKWGIRRIFMDGLLFFGNIKRSYEYLCGLSYEEIAEFFKKKMFNIESMKKRGKSLELSIIAQDDRYLISEMACKSFGEVNDKSESLFEKILVDSWIEYVKKNPRKKVPIRDLLSGIFSKKYQNIKQQTLFAASEILDEAVSSIEEIKEKCGILSKKFNKARKKALKNTNLYLSTVDDLDVYVATSMRNREQFRQMARNCRAIFDNEEIKDLNLRYFDPTMSAADGHENKGLIECLMVKCAKVLIYCSGDKESYGKDAEAAMALSLGKTVIFLCDEEEKQKFYNEVHPLTRLIHFETGVAVGAMVVSNVEELPLLIKDIFENNLSFILENKGEGYFRLRESKSKSVVRVQTNYRMLKEVFWNYYHKN